MDIQEKNQHCFLTVTPNTFLFLPFSAVNSKIHKKYINQVLYDCIAEVFISQWFVN